VRTAYVRSTVHNIITFHRDIKRKYTDRENNFYILHILLFMTRENTIGLLARGMSYIGVHRYFSQVWLQSGSPMRIFFFKSSVHYIK